MTSSSGEDTCSRDVSNPHSIERILTDTTSCFHRQRHQQDERNITHVAGMSNNMIHNEVGSPTPTITINKDDGDGGGGGSGPYFTKGSQHAGGVGWASGWPERTPRF